MKNLILIFTMLSFIILLIVFALIFIWFDYKLAIIIFLTMFHSNLKSKIDILESIKELINNTYGKQ